MMVNARLDTPVQCELELVSALVRDRWNPMPRLMAEQRIKQLMGLYGDFEVVWRFERVPDDTTDTQVGRGAYAFLIGYASARHPAPWNDGGLSRKWGELGEAGQRHEWYFGFSAPAQALAWFYSPELHAKLHGFDVAVTVWAVPRTDRHVGSAQAIFKPGSGARRVACISVPDFVTIFQEGGYHAPESE